MIYFAIKMLIKVKLHLYMNKNKLNYAKIILKKIKRQQSILYAIITDGITLVGQYLDSERISFLVSS